MQGFVDISAINRENKARYSSIIVCITFAQYCICYNILQIQLSTGITKSTRKSVKLLTILVTFPSDFTKRGTCLFILYKNMCDMWNTFLIILSQSPNFCTKNMYMRDWSISIGGWVGAFGKSVVTKQLTYPFLLAQNGLTHPWSKVENYMTHPLTTKFLFCKIWFKTLLFACTCMNILLPTI